MSVKNRFRHYLAFKIWSCGPLQLFRISVAPLFGQATSWHLMARQGSTCKGWKIVGSSPNDPICSKVLPNPNCPTTFAHSLLSSEDKWNYNWLFVPDWQHFTAMHPMKFSHVSCHEKQFYCKDRRNRSDSVGCIVLEISIGIQVAVVNLMWQSSI